LRFGPPGSSPALQFGPPGYSPALQFGPPGYSPALQFGPPGSSPALRPAIRSAGLQPGTATCDSVRRAPARHCDLRCGPQDAREPFGSDVSESHGPADQSHAGHRACAPIAESQKSQIGRKRFPAFLVSSLLDSLRQPRLRLATGTRGSSRACDWRLARMRWVCEPYGSDGSE
jgi:hypothetical protein